MSNLISIEEAASYLGIKKSTLYKYTCSRKVPFIRIGTRVLFSKELLENWIKSHIVEPVISKNEV
jgi:excisionase family DNA binding protein